MGAAVQIAGQIAGAGRGSDQRGWSEEWLIHRNPLEHAPLTLHLSVKTVEYQYSNEEKTTLIGLVNHEVTETEGKMDNNNYTFIVHHNRIRNEFLRER